MRVEGDIWVGTTTTTNSHCLILVFTTTFLIYCILHIIIRHWRNTWLNLWNLQCHLILLHEFMKWHNLYWSRDCTKIELKTIYMKKDFERLHRINKPFCLVKVMFTVDPWKIKSVFTTLVGNNRGNMVHKMTLWEN